MNLSVHVSPHFSICFCSALLLFWVNLLFLYVLPSLSSPDVHLVMNLMYCTILVCYSPPTHTLPLLSSPWPLPPHLQDRPFPSNPSLLPPFYFLCFFPLSPFSVFLALSPFSFLFVSPFSFLCVFLSPKDSKSLSGCDWCLAVRRSRPEC